MRHLLLGLVLLSAITFGAATLVPTTETVYVNAFHDLSFIEFHKKIDKLDKGDVLHIYTIGNGGSSAVCIAMINEILDAKARGVHVITEAAGKMYSGNAFVWLAGDERIVHYGDLFMFHKSIISDVYGRTVPKESLTDTQKVLTNHADQWMMKFTRLRVPNTEIFEQLFKDEYNWCTGEQLYNAGIATKLIGHR